MNSKCVIYDKHDKQENGLLCCLVEFAELLSCLDLITLLFFFIGFWIWVLARC